MAISDIITGQFVCIEQTPASLGDRIMARIIDYVAIFAYIYATANLFMANIYGHISDAALVASFIIVYLPVLTYTFLCEFLFHGQTLGKRIMHIRVTMADGSAPTAGALFLRYVCEIADFAFGGIGIVFIVCTKHHQRLGDMAAGTIVIRRPDKGVAHVSLDEFAYARKGYVVTYPEATRLDDRQVGIMARMLASAKGEKCEERLSLLADKVTHVLGVRRDTGNTRAFLATVLNDYKNIRASE